MDQFAPVTPLTAIDPHRIYEVPGYRGAIFEKSCYFLRTALWLNTGLSLRSATVEFLADPFRLEGDLLFGSGKATKSFVYSDYGEDGAMTFSIDTFVP